MKHKLKLPFFTKKCMPGGNAQACKLRMFTKFGVVISYVEVVFFENETYEKLMILLGIGIKVHSVRSSR